MKKIDIGFQQAQYILLMVNQPIVRNTIVAVMVEPPCSVLLTAPITLKAGDVVMYDPLNNCVEVVQRDGIAIYRRMWLN